jgi:hypothetical protein
MGLELELEREESGNFSLLQPVEKELKKIFKELKLSHDNLYPTAFKMHQHLAQVCGTQNQHTKRIEKMLDLQFAAYKNKTGIAEPQKICDFIEGNNGAEAGGDMFKDVPISALIWFAARNVTDKTNGDGNSKAIETRIYTALHLREHQALRFYDDLSRKLPGGKAENVMKELRTALETNDKLQRKYKRLEQKREELISEREALREDKIRIIHELEEQRRLNDRLRREIDEAGGESMLEQINAMKKEQAFLREERKRLNRENAALVKISSSNFNVVNTREGMKMTMAGVGGKFAASVCGSRDNIDGGSPDELSQLKDMRVAYVGGVESLESCYKEMVESFGCPFCYHCGHCEGGKKAIEGIVDKNDVVFCPIDINSHNACLLVKRACKMRDKPCYFLRSSGVSALRRGLANFTAEVNGERA